MFASLTLGNNGRCLKVPEFFWLVYLNGWGGQLIRQASDNGVLILDQGPVFMISMLILFREEQMRNPFFMKWWKNILQKLGHVLDGIIWLDASDEVLARRINAREQDHAIKGTSLFQARDFLERRRVVLNWAIALLRAGYRMPEVRSYDTGQRSVKDIADELSREFRLNVKPTRAHSLQRDHRTIV